MNVITAYLTRQVAMGNRQKAAKKIANLWKTAKELGRMSYVTENMILKKMENIRQYQEHSSDPGHDEYYVKSNPESRKGFGSRGNANEVCRWREDAALLHDDNAPIGQIWQSKWWFNNFQSVTTSNMAKSQNVNQGGTTVIMDWTAFNDADSTVSSFYPNLRTIKDIARGCTYEGSTVNPDILVSTVPHFGTLSLADEYRQNTYGYYYENSPTIEELESFLEQNLEDIPCEE